MSSTAAPGDTLPSQATLLGGTDGTNIRSLSLDTTGAVKFPGGLRPAGEGALASTVNGISDVGAVSNPAIYDVTSAPNTALDTTVIDVSAWRSVSIGCFTSAGTSAPTYFQIDDTGASLGLLTPAAAAVVVGGWGPGVTGVAGALANVIGLPLPRRIRVTATAAGVGNTVRLRIEGRR